MGHSLIGFLTRVAFGVLIYSKYLCLVIHSVHSLLLKLQILFKPHSISHLKAFSSLVASVIFQSIGHVIVYFYTLGYSYLAISFFKTHYPTLAHNICCSAMQHLVAILLSVYYLHILEVTFIPTKLYIPLVLSLFHLWFEGHAVC